MRGDGESGLVVEFRPVGVVRVDHQLPLLAIPFVRQRELDRLVVGVEDQDEVVVHHLVAVPIHLRDIRTVEIDHHRERVRVLPVGHIHDRTGMVEPFGLRDLVHRVARRTAGEEAAPMQHRMAQTQVDHLGDERQHLLLRIVEVPIRPRDLVVLAVRVVVAALRAHDLVAAADHRDALADEQCGEHVAHLPLAQFVDVADVGRTFHAAVPGAVVALAVAVAFAVRLVVLVVVADQVVHREAVVRGDEVHRGDRSAPVHLVQVRAAHQTAGEFRQRGRLRAPEVAHAVAVSAVPFRPAGGESADLVAAGADIPRFGDELDLGDDRILFDDVEEGGELVHVMELAGQGGRQIEAEAVDVHLGDPVAQAVGDDLQRARRAHQQGVAGAGGVEVVLGVAVDEPVVRLVVDAFEAQCRAAVVAFGGVVVHHVEDDLHAGVVVGLDHRFELVDLFAALPGAGVGVVRGEEADGVVSPVVAQPLLLQEGVVDVLVDRHQLDGGDAQLLQVFDHRRVGQAGVGAADVRGHVHVEVGHAAHMSLVNDRIMVGDVRVPVGAPVEVGVDHHRFHRVPGRVQRVHRRIVVRAFEPVGEQAFIAVDVAFDGIGVGVEQQLVRVAAQSPVRVVGAVDTVSVPLTGLDARQIVMPDIRVLLGHLDAGFAVLIIEQAQLNLVGDLRVDGEIHAGPVVMGAERIHRTWSDLHSSSIAHGVRHDAVFRLTGSVSARMGTVCAGYAVARDRRRIASCWMAIIELDEVTPA